MLWQAGRRAAGHWPTADPAERARTNLLICARIEVCRFLSQNENAGAIDKTAPWMYSVINKDIRLRLRRASLESRLA